jgi:hypothetical protein
VCKEYAVSVYPTLLMFKNGKNNTYLGKRDTKALIDYSVRYTGDYLYSK